MPARLTVARRERLLALGGVAAVQIALALALLSGLRVDFARHREALERLIAVTLDRPPRPPPRAMPMTKLKVERPVARHRSASTPAPSSQPVRVSAPPVITPTLAPAASARSPAGGTGAIGTGSGSGTRSSGSGDGDDDGGGGTDLVQIAGAILPSDYPRDLSTRGVGGRVGVLFRVGTDGRVTGCTVTRSSGIAELDALTCRLIVQRFRYRPSTNSHGRPIGDEVEGEHEWVARIR